MLAMRHARKPSALTETRSLLRAMTRVIKCAEDLGEDELVAVMADFKTNIVRRASLQRDCEKLRAQLTRRYRRGNTTTLISQARRPLARPSLYLVDDTSRDE